MRIIVGTIAAVLISSLATPALALPEGGIWSNNKSKRQQRMQRQAARKEKAETAATSQGAENASTTAVANADSNSALAAGAVASTALPGLANGLTVRTSAGATLGTVSEIVTSADGMVRMVVVTDPAGRAIRLVPNQLSISGGIVTTSQTSFAS